MPRTILFFLAALLFFGCSDSSPDAKTVSYWTVFDFSEGRNEVCFGVFAQLDGNLDEAATVFVENREAGLSWTCRNPVVFENDSGKWVGCPDFCGVAGKMLPEGDYRFVYGDKKEREDDVPFTLRYPDFFKDGFSLEKINGLETSKIQKTAVYDDEDSLVFFGTGRSGWNDPDEILREFKSACTMKKITIMRNYRIMAVTETVDLGNRNY